MPLFANIGKHEQITNVSWRINSDWCCFELGKVKSVDEFSALIDHLGKFTDKFELTEEQDQFPEGLQALCASVVKELDGDQTLTEYVPL